MKKNLTTFLWILTPFLLLGMLFAKIFQPERLWIMVALSAALLVVLGWLIKENRKVLTQRTATLGFHSLVYTVLVIAIVGVLNFLTSRYPQKFDLTKEQIHTLSDQSVKAVKKLNKPLDVVLFASAGARESFRPLLENYKDANPNFKLEMVDPNKEPTRVKQLGIRKENTLYFTYGEKNKKIEDPSEEKITNTLIQLQEERHQTLCVIKGHGEKDLSSEAPEGYKGFKEGLETQGYSVQEINLPTDAKIPADCTSIAILGPTRSFFDPEVKAVSEFLENGGNALFALDLDVTKTKPYAPELLALLEKWYIKLNSNLIVDPVSRIFGVDASTPIITAFAPTHPITKDFALQCFFPLTRSIDILPNPPKSLKLQWIAQSTAKSWAESNLKELAAGKAQMTPGQDKQGPVNVVVTGEGKLNEKAKQESRIVVFGSSMVATNNFARFGGNLDLVLNAATWTLKDDSMISIRSKETEPGKIQLSQAAGVLIFWICIVILPLLIAGFGIFVWWRRKRL